MGCNPRALCLDFSKTTTYGGRVDFAFYGLCALVLALTGWNVLLIRKSPPEKLQRDFQELVEATSLTLARFTSKIQEVVDADQARAVAAIKLKNEFIELIDQQEDVLERTDTKRRRIDASESRQRRRQHKTVGPTDDFDPTDIDSIRNHARNLGVLN